MFNYLQFIAVSQCSRINGYILLGAEGVDPSTLQFSDHVAF